MKDQIFTRDTEKISEFLGLAPSSGTVPTLLDFNGAPLLERAGVDIRVLAEAFLKVETDYWASKGDYVELAMGIGVSEFFAIKALNIGFTQANYILENRPFFASIEEIPVSMPQETLQGEGFDVLNNHTHYPLIYAWLPPTAFSYLLQPFKYGRVCYVPGNSGTTYPTRVHVVGPSDAYTLMGQNSNSYGLNPRILTALVEEDYPLEDDYVCTTRTAMPINFVVQYLRTQDKVG